MFSLEKRRLGGGGHMIVLFNYLKGCQAEKGQDLFFITPQSKTWNNGFRSQAIRFGPNFKEEEFNNQGNC